MSLRLVKLNQESWI